MLALFELGRLAATPGALDAISESHDQIITLLERHASGDWGELDEHDQARNAEALADGTRILSAYRTTDGTMLWIITEADRASTTILLPSEY